MKSFQPHRNLSYFFIAGFVEALAAVLFLLLIPADAKNAWLLGFSKTRFALLAILLMLTALCGWLAVLSRKEAWRERVHLRLVPALDQLRWQFPLILFAWGLAIFSAYFYLFFVHANLTTLHGQLVRLAPFFLLLFTRLVQSILVFSLLAAGRTRSHSAEDAPSPSVWLAPGKVVFILAGIAIFLVIASSALDIIESLTWGQKFYGFRVKLDLDQEANIPTFFASLLLLMISGLCALTAVAKRGQPYGRQWAGLGFIFLLLAIDEASVLHEKLIEPMRAALHTGGSFYYAWVVLAIPVVLLFIIAYLKFFLHLPLRFKFLFGLGFALYLMGTLGFEMFGGWFATHYQEDSPFYNLITTLEETTELSGAVLLIYAALAHLASLNRVFQLGFAPPPQGD